MRLWDYIIDSILVLLALAAVATLFCPCAHAQGIPLQAQTHRANLVRAAHAQWGLNAPVAVFAAQVHQESLWQPHATSPAGAQGLAQFMPATARWLPQVAPQTGTPAPFNPGWALRALCAYNLWLWQRIHAATPCDRMAMTLSAYNGGLGWLRRDMRTARQAGIDPARWWGAVETVNAGRAKWAIHENRGYPRRILQTLTPMYEAAGWGKGVCP